MRLLIIITAWLLTFPAIAGEFVAIGHVTQVTLLPDGADRCPAACPANFTGQVVCISNSCGCGEAQIKIDRVLIGADRPATLISYRLGEWCDPEFPLVNPVVLLRLSDNEEPMWSALHRLDSGDYSFETSSFTRIGSVDVSTLKTDDGLASLRELEQRLGL